MEESWEPTEEQRELLKADYTRLVEACPGAGKTRTIVARYQRLVALKGRRGIGLLSFTNAAVDEVRLRCEDPDAVRSPNFVGTFDAFINRFLTGPIMSAALGRYPQFVDSWHSIPAASFSTGGLPNGVEFTLEHFAWHEDGGYRFVPSNATGRYGNVLRKAHESMAEQIDGQALELRTRLVNKELIVPCSESRYIAGGVLEDVERRAAAECILARFEELIVDEAQDCGPEELTILRRAHAVGVRIVAVADPDQAIFEFRRAKPAALRVFGDDIGRGTRLSGNFRSSPAIVRTGECLRVSSDIDQAVGAEVSNRQAIEVLPFESASEVAAAARDRLTDAGISTSDSVMLAHRADDASASAGASSVRSSSRRAILVLADAALALAVDDDPVRRRQKITHAERSLLRAAGAAADGTIDQDLEELGLSPRWIRDAAIRVLFGADPRQHDRESYTVAVKEIVHGLSWPNGVKAANQRLAKPPEPAWLLLGMGEETEIAPLPWMTVHASKGREFDAVTLVIPKNLRSDDAGFTCLDHWDKGSDAESRRVLYVGATRAKKKLIIAVHHDHYERVLGLLKAS